MFYLDPAAALLLDFGQIDRSALRVVPLPVPLTFPSLIPLRLQVGVTSEKMGLELSNAVGVVIR